MVGIEHREGVMRQRGAARRHERGACNQCDQMTCHAYPPFKAGFFFAHLLQSQAALWPILA
jgi:hypothetical protein